MSRAAFSYHRRGLVLSAKRHFQQRGRRAHRAEQQRGLYAAAVEEPSAEEIAQRAAKSAAGDIDERLSLELVVFGERRGDVVDRRGRVNGELEELHTMPEVDEGH